MAKGKKTGGRNFKPGQSGNPNGRPRTPPEQKALRRFNRSYLEERLNELLMLPPTTLAALKQNRATPMIDLMIIATIERAVESGDYHRVSFLIEQLIGKPIPRPSQEIAEPRSFHDQLVELVQAAEAHHKLSA